MNECLEGVIIKGCLVFEKWQMVKVF